MKKIIAMLAGMLALANTAHAAVYTFQYTTTVSRINYFADFLPGQPVESVALPSGFAAVGDTVVGTFTYDTAESGNVTDMWGTYYAPALSNSVVFGDGSLVAGGASQSGTVWVSDNDAFLESDVLMVQSYYYSPDATDREAVVVTLTDPGQSALNGYQLPGIETTAFRSGEFLYEFRDVVLGPADEFHMYSWRIEGDITSISLVSAVPEPGTYVMLLAGLGIVGWRRRAAK